MKNGKPTPADAATEIRRILKGEGSTEHARGVQWFFKEEIKSHGWFTADLRRLAVRCRKSIQKYRKDFFFEHVAAEKLVRHLNQEVESAFFLNRFPASDCQPSQVSRVPAV